MIFSRCRFWRECSYFNEIDYTCNDKKNSNYCGKFKELEKEEENLKIKMKN
jgi:hypothetical protein